MFTVILTIAGLVKGINNGGKIILLSVFVSAVIATITYFIPWLDNRIKGSMMTSIPAIMAIILSISRGGDPTLFNIYLLTMVMQSLYFHKNMMMYYGIFLMITLSTVYLINPVFIVGANGDSYTFFSAIIVMLCTNVVLTYSTKWERMIWNK